MVRVHLAVFGLVVAACVSGQSLPETPPPDSADVSVVSDLRFTVDDLVAGPAARTVDIASAPVSFSVEAPGEAVGAVGILAVDTLVGPAIDGRVLLAVLPPESSFTVRPDGSAVFAYWDLFEPRWKGREPRWEELELEEGTVLVDRLGDDGRVAKVQTAATLMGEGLFVDDPERGGVFAWSGELRYCFDFGRPVRSLALADADRPTVLEVAPGFEIRVSDLGGEWTTVWVSEDEGRVEPRIELPETLIGSETLCVALDGGSGLFSMAERLMISVVVDAADLAELTRFPAGSRRITYDDAPGSTHRAVMFWEAPAGVAMSQEPVDVDEATVERRDGSLEIAFPSGSRIVFRLDDTGAPVAIDRVDAGGVPVLGARTEPQPGFQSLSLLDDGSFPGPSFDWTTYRQAFFEEGSWPSLGRRGRRSIDLVDARFEGASAVGSEVILAWTVDAPAGPGRVEWILSDERDDLGGLELAGIGIRWRVGGLQNADRLDVVFPLLLQPGERSLAQYFRTLEEDAVAFTGPPRRPRVAWFGESQSFLFTTGTGRTVVAAFDMPIWATVSSTRTAARDDYRFELPLGAGDVRETPTLRWLAAAAGADDRWSAADLWARVYEDLRSAYLADAGVVDTRALPTLIWNQPLDDDFFADLEEFVASGEHPEVGWFDRYADTMLDRVADAAIPSILIQAPWVSDAEDPELVSSFHAPRSLDVSPMLGGVEGLTRLVEEAHRRGVEVVLWYPSAYSIRSPLFEQRPDWLVWTPEGRPDDGGWGDILVVDNGDEYRRYAVGQLAELRRVVPFDGVWMDSWVGIAVPTDYSQPQPGPRLDQAIALQRAFTEMGLDQIVIEGLGPLGRGDAYGDYETYSGPPDPLPEQIADMERLRGREYLLYRIGAGVYLDIDVYERALASGGAAHIANLDELDALGDDARARLRQLNRALAAVVDQMDERTLLVVDDRWVGVAWRDADTGDTVVFAFEDLAAEIAGTVSDVVEGSASLVSGPFVFRAHRVYVVSS